jgi:hypothetical protein
VKKGQDSDNKPKPGDTAAQQSESSGLTTPNPSTPISGQPIPGGLTPPGTPPISPQVAPMLALQLGVGLPQQQNPEVIAHITQFLAHDSDNRLAAVNSSGERNHRFRLNALYIGTALLLIFFGAPLGVELYRGDMVFVRDFVEKYLPVAAMVILALFAGPKIADIFKG